jgi:hypothetical protein
LMRVALLLSLLAACRYTGSFTCELDEECRARGSVGRCDVGTGFCTFDDATCPTGFRYADSAGDLANTCVMDPSASDAGIDAVDASTFDPATCPAAYNGVLSGYPNAKYVMLQPTCADEGRFKQQVARCEQGLAGATHAVIVDTPAKAAALATFIGSGAGNVWIGLVQSMSATAVGSDWITFAGQPVDAALWNTAQTEPDDANMSEGDHAEQAGAFGTGGLYDLPAGMAHAIVCECDGRATAPMAVQWVQAVVQ